MNCKGTKPVYRGREQLLTPAEKQTKFAGARLYGRFANVDLSDTVFAGSDCTNATFVSVDLRRADFSRAVLTNVLFLRCDLLDTRFTEASVSRTRFIACSGLDPDTARALRHGGANLPKEAPSQGGRHVSLR